MAKYNPHKVEKKWPSGKKALEDKLRYNHREVEQKWPSFAKATEGKHSYNHSEIEKKWQDAWTESKLYEAKDFDKRDKFYCLDMFPYPSGEGLHVGHWRGYVLSDMFARYQMLRGKNVLHPMGYDAFGLPAENAAIKANSHPKIFTQKAILKFKEQLKRIGAMFDWSREINTSDPSYYQWTQWLFIQLYKNKLAFRKRAPVNWCPSCQTVLANEQVIAGECERCNATVIKKELVQWFFKITEYAEDLLKNLDELDWPERTKTLQRNWIGKSEGTLIKFKIVIANEVWQSSVKKQIASPLDAPRNDENIIKVFTTRPDTLFGATFLVLAPEHPMIENLKIQNPKSKEIKDYVNKSKEESEIERESREKKKTGVFTGIYAINPVNNEKIPIWIADYVLSGYGTGACMAVPAHDQRDFEFAQKFNLPIKMVVCPNYPEPVCPILDRAYEDKGHLVDSGQFSGMPSEKGGPAISQWLKDKKLAVTAVSYRLRDWLISRQRYWGTPIPIIYCNKCGEVPVPEKDLPVLLPEDIEFNPQGESPLKQSKEFLNATCPRCGGKARRETDTMDTFVCSSWYYLRYADPRNNKRFAIRDKLNYWLPVDLYVGGVEHAILHLLYARFISLALQRLKITNYSKNGEPFKKLFNIGMIYLHGAKMSKSKGNVASPDELIDKFGTDALRGYELFIGPADQDNEWQVGGISGVYRFLEKIWEVYHAKIIDDIKKEPFIEQKIKIVSEEIESIRPNTAISHLMELFNYLKKEGLSKDYAKKINILLAPFFPHISEEIWQLQGNNDSVFLATWPEYDKSLTKILKVTVAIQINGKTRGLLEVEQDLPQKEVEKLAQDSPKIKSYLEDKNIKKVIYVAGRILNFVIE